MYLIFFFQAEVGIRDFHVTGVQTCALPISLLLQAIQKADEGRPFDADHVSELPLGNRPRSREVQQSDPARLGEVQVPQSLVQPGTPPAADTRQLQRELLRGAHMNRILMIRVLSYGASTRPATLSRTPQHEHQACNEKCPGWTPGQR